jgi:hypothetical protein
MIRAPVPGFVPLSNYHFSKVSQCDRPQILADKLAFNPAALLIALLLHEAGIVRLV